MIIGTGIDIVQVGRIKKIIEKWDTNFLNRIYTRIEVDYCQSKEDYNPHFAARFAAKEAFFKMISVQLGELAFKDVGVINNSDGKPELYLSENATRLVKNQGITTIHLSLSHEKKYAIAQVIGEGVVE